MLLYTSCICLFLAGAQASHLIALAGPGQFHAQDALGQYSYGYSGGPSAKIESKTLDGVTRGGYSYIDANGILQSVNYISDSVNGFRVAATNLPQAPLPEAIKAVEPLPTVKLTQEDVKPFPTVLPTINFENPIPAVKLTPEEVKLTSVKAAFPEVQPSVISALPALKYSPLSVPSLNLSPLTLTYPSPYLHLSPLSPLLNYPDWRFAGLPTVSALPTVPALPTIESLPEGELPKVEAKKAELPKEEEIKERRKRAILYSPLLAGSTQYEVKDNIGNYAYGYQNPLSAKAETRFFGGPTNGAYSYVDANGLLQSVHYTADSNGFRVAATNLPRA